MPSGRAGRPRRRPGRPARLLRRQRDRHRGAARGHGPQRRAPPGAGLVHGGLRGRRLRLRRARPGPACPEGRERSGGGPLRAPLPAVLSAAHRGHRHRGCPAGSPQRLRGQQARPGASGRHLGPDDRRVARSRCATTTCTGRGCRGTRRTPGWRRSSGPRWREAGRRRCTRTASSGATSCTCHDVARANLAALRAGVPGSLRAFNVASGEPHTVGEMAAALAGAFGGPGSHGDRPLPAGRRPAHRGVARGGRPGLGFRAETGSPTG